MYYCDQKLGAIDPITGAEEVLGGIIGLVAGSKASDAASKAQAAQLKAQREALAAQMAMANQQTVADAGNTTLYIVGGLLAVAVLGVVMSMRGSK